jgi:hypothetical protein
MSSFGDLIWRQRSARKAGSSSRQFVYSFSDATDEAARLIFGKAKWVRLEKSIRYEGVVKKSRSKKRSQGNAASST